MAEENKDTNGKDANEVDNEDHQSTNSDEYEIICDNMTFENSSHCTMTTINQDQNIRDEDCCDAFQDVSSMSNSTIPLPSFASSKAKSLYSENKVAASNVSSIDPNSVLFVQNEIDSLADVREAINNRRKPAEARRPKMTVIEMNDRIGILSAQLVEKCALEDELENEKEVSKHFRRQLDETMARFLELEEQFQHFQKLNEDDLYDVGGTQSGLNQLLLSKDGEIERLNRDLNTKSDQLTEAMSQVKLLVEELNTATGLLAQVNEQRREDQLYIDCLKGIYERRIRFLTLNYAVADDEGEDNYMLECPFCKTMYTTDAEFESHLKGCYDDHRNGSSSSSPKSPVEWMQ